MLISFFLVVVIVFYYRTEGNKGPLFGMAQLHDRPVLLVFYRAYKTDTVFYLEQLKSDNYDTHFGHGLFEINEYYCYFVGGNTIAEYES